MGKKEVRRKSETLAVRHPVKIPLGVNGVKRSVVKQAISSLPKRPSWGGKNTSQQEGKPQKKPKESEREKRKPLS